MKHLDMVGAWKVPAIPPNIDWHKIAYARLRWLLPKQSLFEFPPLYLWWDVSYRLILLSFIVTMHIFAVISIIHEIWRRLYLSYNMICWVTWYGFSVDGECKWGGCLPSRRRERYPFHSHELFSEACLAGEKKLHISCFPSFVWLDKIRYCLYTLLLIWSVGNNQF